MRELFLIEQNNVIQYADIAVSQLQETLESSEGLFWLDVEQMTDEDAAFLLEFKEFRAHPLSVKACREAAGRPYLAEFPEQVFMIFNIQEEIGATPTRLGLFLTPDYLITVHSTPLGFLQEVKDRIQQDYLLMRSPGFAMALILQAMTDHLEPLIDQLDADITAIESNLSQLANQHDIQTIAEKKHQLANLLQILSPQCEMLHDMWTQGNLPLQPETIIQIRDVYHRLKYQVETLPLYQERLSDLSLSAATRTALQLNTSIGRLSTISAVFLPVISLAALLGINERLIGLDPPVALGLAAVLSILSGGIVAMLARRK
ncbi:MAG TPA: hypothetical protein EYQ20_06680 [candidate division Zixibacteria bacterium]|jgi:magnesium transporter|nr:hypothetical protein [candidate division Zixibacteria bacterium]